MDIYDVTVPLSPALPIYPGDPVVTITPVQQLSKGDMANVSRLMLGSHTGTHVDAPRHFFGNGASVEALDLRVLMGPVQVCAWPYTRHITAADIQAMALTQTPRVLFKTPNTALWRKPGFQADYVALTASAARLLVDMGTQLVGIDYLSVDAYARQDFPVHRILLGAGVVIVEGLDLSAVPAGQYELLVLPLLLAGGDGAPARVVLRAFSS